MKSVSKKGKKVKKFIEIELQYIDDKKENQKYMMSREFQNQAEGYTKKLKKSFQ